MKSLLCLIIFWSILVCLCAATELNTNSTTLTNDQVSIPAQINDTQRSWTSRPADELCPQTTEYQVVVIAGVMMGGISVWGYSHHRICLADPYPPHVKTLADGD